MPHCPRILPVIMAGAWLAGATLACSPEPASPPGEPAAATPAPATPPSTAPAADTATTEPAAGQASVPGTPPQGQAESPRFVPPVRGTAEIAYAPPKTQVKNNVVITTILVKNTSTGSIAGLTIEEYWWDKSSNPVTGDSVRLQKPLLPGETTTLTLETPKDPRMFRNTYVFRHAFGQIKATAQKSLE